MLVNSKKMLESARKENFSVPATNFIDIDSARVFVNVAEERGLPLMLPFAQSHSKLISLEEAAIIGKYLAESVSVPIALHLDHGEDYEFIKQAIDLGFKSVMFDGSSLDIEENIEITKKVVNYAHARGVTVEAELGYVGANEGNYETTEVVESVHTDTEDVLDFVSQTGVDSLAVSIGTAHGAYKGEPEINFERLKEITEVTPIPLVLHGGSSSGDENLDRCSKSAISKINIFTDFLNGAYNNISKNKPKDYIELKAAANEGMAEVLNHYYDVFNTKAVDL